MNVACTQPRRLAAVSVAERVAEEVMQKRGISTSASTSTATNNNTDDITSSTSRCYNSNNNNEDSDSLSSQRQPLPLLPLLVGYQVRLHSNYDVQHTKLLFCTTGVFLRKICGETETKTKTKEKTKAKGGVSGASVPGVSSGVSGDEYLDSLTHLIIDEVCECVNLWGGRMCEYGNVGMWECVNSLCRGYVD